MGRCGGGTFRESFGQHRPCCWGSLLVAHTGRENLSPVSLVLILVPGFCWFYFLAEDVGARLGHACGVLIGLTGLLSLALLFVTMLTEPGILPTITYEEYSDENPDVPVRVITRIVLDGREYELKQFRAKFSRYTGNCIECFDHYCPWVGNAVGKRNYRCFVFFMLSVLSLAALVAGSCTAYLVAKAEHEDKSLIESMESSVAATALAVYGYCMLLSLCGLFAFHIKAIASNTTTNEILKGAYTASRNPHDQGCFTNCWTFLCSPIPVSRVAQYCADSPLLQDAARPIGSGPTTQDAPGVATMDAGTAPTSTTLNNV